MELVDIYWISILIPFGLGLLHFKRFEKSFKMLFLYVAYGTLNEIVTRVLMYSGVKNTMPLIHVYQMISFAILAFFFVSILNGKKMRTILVFTVVLFELFGITNLLFFQSIQDYPQLPRTIVTFFVIILSMIYFYKVMVEASILKLRKEPLVWINAALLIYYSSNLFFTVLFKLILEYSREFSKLTTFYFSINLTLFYILIAIGFWKAGRQNTVKTS